MKCYYLCSIGDLQDISQVALRASVDEGLKILGPCKWDSRDVRQLYRLGRKLCVCLFNPKEKKERAVISWSGLPSEIQLICYQIIYGNWGITFEATSLIRVTLSYPTERKFAVGKVGCAPTRASKLFSKIKMYSSEYSQWWQVDIFRGWICA